MNVGVNNRYQGGAVCVSLGRRASLEASEVGWIYVEIEVGKADGEDRTCFNDVNCSGGVRSFESFYIYSACSFQGIFATHC